MLKHLLNWEFVNVFFLVALCICFLQLSVFCLYICTLCFADLCITSLCYVRLCMNSLVLCLYVSAPLVFHSFCSVLKRQQQINNHRAFQRKKERKKERKEVLHYGIPSHKKPDCFVIKILVSHLQNDLR